MHLSGFCNTILLYINILKEFLIQRIKDKAEIIGKKEYIQGKYTSIYKTIITKFQVSEMSKYFNISEEFINSILLSTSSIRVI